MATMLSRSGNMLSTTPKYMRKNAEDTPDNTPLAQTATVPAAPGAPLAYMSTVLAANTDGMTTRIAFVPKMDRTCL